MKFLKCLAVVSLAAVTASAQQQHSFTNSPNVDIPQSNPNGIFSTINVSGLSGIVTNVTLTLDISGGANGDLYGYLSGDNGGFSVLINRVGRTSTDPVGYMDPGMNLTLSDSAPSDIHTYGGNGGLPLTGTWQPDGRNIDPQLVVDTDPRTSFLSSFDGRDPNGAWTIFFADFANGYQSTLVSWSLSFETIPEPSPAALSLIGFAGLWLWRRRK